VAVDPKAATEMFLKIPEGPERERRLPNVVNALTLDDEERWRNAHRQVGIWFVDDEDPRLEFYR
jgi:hypothetical protein